MREGGGESLNETLHERLEKEMDGRISNGKAWGGQSVPKVLLAERKTPPNGTVHRTLVAVKKSTGFLDQSHKNTPRGGSRRKKRIEVFEKRNRP